MNTNASAQPATLSACLIVKNEALTIERIVGQALACCDEVVVCDTGSTDDTVALAAQLSARVKIVHFEWCDDFSAARNFATSQCSMEWVIWLDADDVLPLATLNEIARMRLEELCDHDLRAVWGPYHYSYTPDGTLAQVVNRERIFRNRAGHRWVGPVHETLEDGFLDSTHNPRLIVEHRTAPENNPRRQGRNIRLLEPFVDLEKSEVRWLWLLGAEYSTEQRYDDAVRVFQAYLDRTETSDDIIGERYAVLMRLTTNAFAQRNHQAAAHWALRLVAQDLSRAEGYALLGMAMLARNATQAAYPLLIAAAVCPKPPPQNIVILDPLYTHQPTKDLLTAQLLPELRTEFNRRLRAVTKLLDTKGAPVAVNAPSKPENRHEKRKAQKRARRNKR